MKITLRKPAMTDLKDFHEIFNDKEVAKQLSDYPYPLSLEKAKNKLQETIDKNNQGDYYEFSIITDSNFVGLIVLEKPSKDKKTFTLGYAIGRKFWNKGITTEAIKQICDFGFNKLNLDKIQADNDEDNPASGRVLEKNGFKFVKKMKKTRHELNKKVNVLYWERLK